MASKAVAVPEASAVPELAPTPASTITAEDIAIPTLYMGQRSQTIVDGGLASKGDIYAALGQSDNEPEILWESDSKSPGVLIVPLFMFKSWSFSPGPGAPLEMWPFEAKGREYPDGPPLTDRDPKKRAYLVYNYTLYLPEVNPEMPYKTRFYRSGAPAAQKINQVLSLNHELPSYHFGWRWTTATQTKQGVGSYTIPQLTREDPSEDQVAGAKALHDLLIPGLLSRQQMETEQASTAPSI